MGFVIFQTASGTGVFDATTGSLLTAAVTLSMLVAPLLLLVAPTAGRATPRRRSAKRTRSAREQHAR